MRKKFFSIVLSILLVFNYCCLLAVFPVQAEETNLSYDFNTVLEKIFSEEFSFEQQERLAQNMKNDYSIIDLDNSEEITNILDNYSDFLQSEFSYEAISKTEDISDDVYLNNLARQENIKRYAKNMEMQFIKAYSAFKVDDVNIHSDIIELQIYEWVFVEYTENGYTDMCGYGFNHIISIHNDSDTLVVVSDEILDDEFKTDVSKLTTYKNAVDNSVSSNVSDSVGSYYYNPDDAVAYSDTYVYNYNPNYSNYNSIGGDCANFVSQSLHAGGLEMTDGWYWYSYSNRSASWSSCTYQISYLSNIGNFIRNPVESELLKGSPVYYYSSSGVQHTALCVGTNSSGTPIVNAHNTDRYRVNWQLGGTSYWAGGFSTIQLNVVNITPTDIYNPDNYPFPTRDIYYNSSSVMTGSDVKWIQAVLYQLGYSISVDGSFGPASETVVKQFQSDYCLEVDGSVGPATRQKLYDLWNKNNDIEAPYFEEAYITQVNSGSFRVCAVPKDNVGINNLRVATWTKSDQSDLIWHDMSNNGYGTYFVDINRVDYSSTSNSFYYNHIYAYDYSNNYRSVACNMDYRVASNTGMSVFSGKYRIVTAVNPLRALDVYDASTLSGANIQINSNLSDPKQIFELEYIDGGYYKIRNIYTGLLLDVEGDTYISGTNVQQCIDNGGANQNWIISQQDDGYYTIVARSNGLALDLAYAKDEDGANVQVHTINGTIAQKWRLRRVIEEDMITIDDVTINNESDDVVPNIIVSADEKTLIEGSDYNIEITKDISTLKGEVTITGINNYCETISKSFNIVILETEIPENTDTGSTGDCTWVFNIDTGELTISGDGNMDDYTTKSSVPWYSYRTDIKSVIFKDGVNNIGDMAFASCSNLTDVTLSDTVASIGNKSFLSCSSLANISSLNNIEIIEENAFTYCDALESLEFSDNINYVGSGAFSYTGWYDNQPDGLVYVGKILYKYKGICPDEVAIADGTKSITATAFGNRTTLKSVVIPDSISVIPSEAFLGCSNLVSVEFSDNLTSIGSHAFRSCTSLTEITIPRNVTSIGEKALGYYSSDGGYAIVENFTICGYTETIAETYANENGIEFVDLEAEILLGDVNLNGIIDIKDVTEIQKYIAGTNNVNRNEFASADVNSDGIVNVMDATLIQKYCASLITEF